MAAKRSYEYESEMRRAVVKAGLAERRELKGCAFEEISDLGATSAVDLPAAYRGFLAAMGRSAGRLFEGIEILYRKLPIRPEGGLLQLPPKARRLADGEQDGKLYDKAFIFAREPDGSLYCFVVEEAVDDPPVFRLRPGEGPPMEAAASFSRWFEDRVLDAKGCGGANQPKAGKTTPVPDRYRDQMRRAIKKAKVASADELLECSEEEIAELEKQSGVAFPAAYKGFLRAMGRGAGTFFQGTDIFQQSLPIPRAHVQELIDRDPKAAGFNLPPKAFVFAGHQGYTFLYFDAEEGDDPPVLCYEENTGQPRRVAERFTQWFEASVRDHGEPS